ncbi:RIPP2 protein, partial [Brachypteracias leptosomus]|nr:RIPP2 protein [Brachypteracias leptosomus]
MEDGGMGCGCRPRPLSAELPSRGCSPLISSSSHRCGARPGPALPVLPLPRRPVSFWRPWVPAPDEAGRRSGTGTGLGTAAVTNLLYTCFRLFWPKSRCYDYLYQEAEALLKNFPVQATISFYEDSDSEDEDELEQDSRMESDC